MDDETETDEAPVYEHQLANRFNWRVLVAFGLAGVAAVFDDVAMTVNSAATAVSQHINWMNNQAIFREEATVAFEKITNPKE